MIGFLIALASPASAPSALPTVLPVQTATRRDADSVTQAQIFATLDATFAALENGDPATFLAQVFPEGRVTAVGTLPTGVSGLRLSSFAEYAARMTPGKGFRERISDPEVRVDGDAAMVWAFFTIERDGKIVSCGYDHFDMVRQNAVWKIMNLTFSTRTTGCPAR